MNTAEKSPVIVFRVELGRYVIQTGDQVTVIHFT